MSWPPEVRRRAGELVRSWSAVHRPDGRPDIFVFTTPRSGSTWLMELLSDQPGFKAVSEPFDLRNPSVRRRLGLVDWVSLYNHDSEPRVRRYIEGFRTGTLRFLNPRPRLWPPRPVTHRIVFKILHFGEDRISWFRDTFGGRVVLLLRHPIAVSLSRDVLPRLQAFLESDYRRHFSAQQLAFARQLAASGNKLERGVLDWCLQNAVPLRQAEPDWIVISYEQLVLEPRPVLERLAAKLDLPDPERLFRSLRVPSRTVNKSDRLTAQVLDQPDSAERSSYLIEKWRRHVGPEVELRVMEILKRFDVDVYAAGHALPTGRLAFGQSRERRPSQLAAAAAAGEA